jgi:hypothetical protein
MERHCGSIDSSGLVQLLLLSTHASILRLAIGSTPGVCHFPDLFRPEQIFDAQLHDVIVVDHFNVFSHLGQGLFDVPPALSVLEKTQVVGDQVSVLTPRALYDDDAVVVGVLGELLDGSRVADRAGKDNRQLASPLLGARDRGFVDHYGFTPGGNRCGGPACATIGICDIALVPALLARKR